MVQTRAFLKVFFGFFAAQTSIGKTCFSISETLNAPIVHPVLFQLHNCVHLFANKKHYDYCFHLSWANSVLAASRESKRVLGRLLLNSGSLIMDLFSLSGT